MGRFFTQKNSLGDKLFAHIYGRIDLHGETNGSDQPKGKGGQGEWKIHKCISKNLNTVNLKLFPIAEYAL